MGALDGITVLDFSAHIAGPYATKLLADLGARVIKVERPGGDPIRSQPPFLGDEPVLERGAAFQFLNTNKASLVLDLQKPGARDVVAALVPRADLVVSAFEPATAEELGVTPEALPGASEVPFLWLTNFGREGPYRDYHMSETTLFAMGGEMFSTGLLDREPLKYGGTAALMQCGAMGAIAALGAIHAYEVHGIGQVVDLPLFDVQIANVDRRSSSILSYRFSGRIQGRAPGPSTGLAGGIYPAADGYVEVTATGGNYWQRFVEMIGDDTLREPRFASPVAAADPSTKEAVDAIVYPWMLTHTRAEIWSAARRAHAMVAPLFDATDLFNDANLRDRGYWVEAEHETLGRFPMIGRPYLLEKTPWELRRPAPVLGGDTRSILGEAGFDDAAIDRLYQEGVVA